jgi:hypothetical protein
MGILRWLLTSSPKDLAAPIEAVSDLYTTEKARLLAETALKAQENAPMLAQSNINAIIAQSKSLFVSGWQPMLGWTCGFLILLFYAPQIMIITYIWGKACFHADVVKPFPMSPKDILNLVYLLFGVATHSLLQSRPTRQ